MSCNYTYKWKNIQLTLKCGCFRAMSCLLVIKEFMSSNIVMWGMVRFMCVYDRLHNTHMCAHTHTLLHRPSFFLQITSDDAASELSLFSKFSECMSLNVQGLATKGTLENHPSSIRKHGGRTTWKDLCYQVIAHSFVHSWQTYHALTVWSFPFKE